MSPSRCAKAFTKIILSIFASSILGLGLAQIDPPPPVENGGLPGPNDTARFLAGMPLSSHSPLAALTDDPAWQEHSANFEAAFAKLNSRQLQNLHAWQAQ